MEEWKPRPCLVVAENKSFKKAQSIPADATPGMQGCMVAFLCGWVAWDRGRSDPLVGFERVSDVFNSIRKSRAAVCLYRERYNGERKEKANSRRKVCIKRNQITMLCLGCVRLSYCWSGTFTRLISQHGTAAHARSELFNSRCASLSQKKKSHRFKRIRTSRGKRQSNINVPASNYFDKQHFFEEHGPRTTTQRHGTYLSTHALHRSLQSKASRLKTLNMCFFLIAISAYPLTG